LIAVLVIVGLLAMTLIAINPAKQFEEAEQKTEQFLIGKHAYNKTSGAYRGERLEVKPCNTAPELTCYVVNQPTFMRPIEAPVDNSVVKDEAPTPSEQP
jgi:Tfp pilus assembly protein PilV